MRGCSVTGCDNKHYARGLCRSDYQKAWYRGFEPLEVEKKTCHCGKATRARGLCDSHYQSWWYRNHALTEVNTEHANYKGAECGYGAAHDRIRRLRGRAHEHVCVWCGEQANNWALKAEAENLRANSRGTVYSLNPWDYQPMCQACHKGYDATVGHRKAKPGRKKVSA